MNNNSREKRLFRLKLFFLAFGMLLVASSAFSNVEMDLNLYMMPFSKYNLEEDIDFRVRSPIGLEAQFAFMLGAPVKFLDLGINLSLGADFGWQTHLNRGDYYSQDVDKATAGLNLGIGPVVRFNLGDMHSIYVSPGLSTSLLAFYYEKVTDHGGYWRETEDKLAAGVDLAFNLDLGYRVWLLNKPGFHLGIDVGLDMRFPFVGRAWLKGDDNYLIESGETYKIYLGVCFNFGGKSPDKHRK